MTEPLRAHVASAHGQGAVDVSAIPLDVVETWHDLEHGPLQNHADHAHDEFTARRRRVRLVDASEDAAGLRTERTSG